MTTQLQSMPDGLIVVFEGMDGVGKTTQLKLAREALEAEKWPVHTTRNLGGTPIGEALRDVMKSQLKRPSETNLYLSLAIQEALLEALKKERAEGKIILMDRSPLSLAAYEIYGGGLDESLGWRYVAAGMLELCPDLTVMYTADPAMALARAKQKSKKATDYFESQSLAYFERVAEGYEIATKRYKDDTVVIDAHQSVDEVHLQTMKAIDQAINQKLSNVAN